MKSIKINFSKKRLLLFFFAFLFTFLIFRYLYIHVFKPSLAVDSTRPSDEKLASKYSCSGNSYSFSHVSTDKQWVNVIVRINNTIISGVSVNGKKSESEKNDEGTICTGTGTTLQDVSNKATGAWFRYMDSSGKFTAKITYQIPETGKFYSVTMNKSNSTNTVDNMTVNSSSSTNVFCYKYGNTSNTETGTSCAKWASNTVYAPKDASVGDFTWVVLGDTSSSAPIHQLDVNIMPKFNVTYLDYDGTVIKSTTAYDYQTNIETGVSKPYDPQRASTQQYDYSFDKWSPDVDYNTETLVDDVVYTATYNATLRKYSITFLDYDGSIISGPTSYDYGTSASSIKPTDPTRAGYIFAGWDSTVSDVTEDKVYTAVYKKLHYVVFTDGFGNNLSGSLIVDNESAILPSNPTRPGYIFAGWDQDTSGITSDMTINATWTIETYTITYNYNGGEANNTSTYTVESDDIVVINPTREGYEFVGWTGTELSSPTNSLVIPKGSISNRTYEANWEINQYSVTLEKDEGIDTVSGDKVYDFNEEVTIEAILKEGYDFSGWYEGDSLISEDIKYTFNMISRNVTYKAISTIKTYDINLDKRKDDVSFFTETYTVNYNDNKSFIFEDEEGYVIESVIVDEEYIEFSNMSYEFLNIVSDHNITVNYSLDSNNDDIPDKYQKTITYKVINGIFSESQNSDDIVIPFNSHEYNNGKWEEKEIRLGTIPEVIPNEGYLEGSWDIAINKDSIVRDNVIYTYTCVLDYKYTQQPFMKFQIELGTFEIEWATNFVPIKIEKYNAEDNSLIETLEDPTATLKVETLKAGETVTYYYRAYYGTENDEYIDSEPVTLKRILLPATGDTGIITYTVIGLIMIALNSLIIFFSYKMKYSKN